MTDRDKIIALAGVMGWHCVAWDEDDLPGDKPKLVEQCRNGQWVLVTTTRRHWSPLTNISDAFEVQAAIAPDKREAFITHLASPRSGKHPKDRTIGVEVLLWWCTDATALQRSDAILLAYGFEVGK